MDGDEVDELRDSIIQGFFLQKNGQNTEEWSFMGDMKHSIKCE